MSGLEEYKFLRRIFFRLTIAEAGRAPPAGFLFLCPMEHFQTGPTSFRWPNRPAYWSLDSKGLEALSTVEAARLGFPPFQLTTIVVGKFWDASVYAGLRQFHQAKGFDPDSQEIAIHLGQPLFRLSKDVNPPFAHVDDRFEERPDEELEYIYEDDTDEDITSINDDAHAEDGECSFRDFNRKESDTEGNDARVDGQLEARAQPHNVPREVHQEPNGCNSSRTDQQTHTGPQIANEGATGGDLVRRFFWQLQQGLLPTETDNIDTYLISPFPI
ncbi:hypothetical protein B0H16DRAFT_46771 [Mycena metata]|uniref:Uncharacterized protein n=1 Tax=Mycena metata TaxID=1033252 RepID=A0AAD7K259_9AGAR|nr:hypothetical protein B0H16DRAFT_46771 [Mycena metata]